MKKYVPTLSCKHFCPWGYLLKREHWLCSKIAVYIYEFLKYFITSYFQVLFKTSSINIKRYTKNKENTPKMESFNNFTHYIKTYIKVFVFFVSILSFF